VEFGSKIPARDEAAEVEFGSNFQLGAKPRWNLDPNFSWGRSRGGIWIQISAGGEVEVEFGIKFQLRAELRWNLHPNSSCGEAEMEFGFKFQLGAKPRWNLRSYYSKGRSRGEI